MSRQNTNSNVERRRIRKISVITPMRNESEHVESLIEDIGAQDFDGEVRLIVADGCSTDDSVERALAAARKQELPVSVVANPLKNAAAGLNECLRQATGDLFVRMDCHARYPSDYLRRCARASEDTGAEVVGGILVPRGLTRHERAVACAMDSPFGGIDWTRDALKQERTETDVAVYGAFKPRAFELAGVFDTSLVRNQDDEFTLRLRTLGGRVVLDPSIHVYYIPRKTFRAVFQQYYEYGRWKIPVMIKYRTISSARSLAPIAFVASLGALAPLALRSRPSRRLLLCDLAIYTSCAAFFGVRAVKGRHESLGLLPRVVGTFATFHVAYGAGMISGLLRASRPSRRA
jgi:succinoglycan biosynthesis protein ExoA